MTTLELPSQGDLTTLMKREMQHHPAGFEGNLRPMRRLDHHPAVISLKEAAAHEAQEDQTDEMSL